MVNNRRGVRRSVYFGWYSRLVLGFVVFFWVGVGVLGIVLWDIGRGGVYGVFIS